MKLSNFLVVKAIVSLVFGIGFELIPSTVWTLFGGTLDPSGIVMARYFGACLIGIGLICWFYRSANLTIMRGITLSLFIADTIGFLAALTCQLSKLTNSLGWIIVVIWFLLAVGLGYFFMKSKAS